MADYIKREEAIDELFKLKEILDNKYAYAIRCAIGYIQTMPKGIGEVVRCKDCIYNTSNTYIPGKNRCYKNDMDVDGDGCCSYGEHEDD